MTEQTLTIRPQPAAAITGAAARISRRGAVTWTAIISSHSRSVCSAGEVIAAWPALLTRPSRRPKRSRHTATIRSAAPAAVTSSARLSPPHSRAVSSSASRPRATSRTRAPAPASIRAVAAPIPLLAPVTTKALSLRSTCTGYL
ncbi:MAG: hypothetical protein U0R71_16735 [Solirubrobacterales bacterium]